MSKDKTQDSKPVEEKPVEPSKQEPVQEEVKKEPAKRVQASPAKDEGKPRTKKATELRSGAVRVDN